MCVSVWAMGGFKLGMLGAKEDNELGRQERLAETK